MLVFLFCLSTSLCLSFLCAMCSHVNRLDPTHLVTWLLVNLPHLSSFVTLLICSPNNLLVFAVLCQFFIVSSLVALNMSCSCLALPCPALPCPALLFPYGVVLGSLFCLFFNNKRPFSAVLNPRFTPNTDTHGGKFQDCKNVFLCMYVFLLYYYLLLYVFFYYSFLQSLFY